MMPARIRISLLLVLCGLATVSAAPRAAASPRLQDGRPPGVDLAAWEGLRSPEPAVRAAAARRLCDIPDSPPDLLLPLLNDPVPAVADAAEEALTSLGASALERVGEFLAGESVISPGKPRAARVLGRLGLPGAIPHLRAVLLRTRAGWRGSPAAFEALHALGPSSVRALLELSEYPELRDDSYRTLLRYRTEELEAALLAILFDPAEELGYRMRIAAETELILGTAATWLALAGFHEQVAGDPALPRGVRTAARLEAERLLRHGLGEGRPPLDETQVREWERQRARDLEAQAAREDAAHRAALEARRRSHEEQKGLARAREALARKREPQEDLFLLHGTAADRADATPAQAPTFGPFWKELSFPAFNPDRSEDESWRRPPEEP